MNKYLEKIAKSVEKKKNNWNAGLAATALMGTNVIGGTVSGRVNSLYSNKAMAGDAGVSKETIDKIVPEVMKRTNSTTNIHETGMHPELVKVYEDQVKDVPHFNTREHLKGMSQSAHRQASKGPFSFGYSGQFKNPDISKNFVNKGNGGNAAFLHEMGHAEDFSKGLPGLKRKVAAPGRALHMGGSSVIGSAMLSNEKTRDYAWAAPLVGGAPTIREEFAANHNARKILKEFGGKPSSLNRMIRGNVASYVAPVLAQSAALAGFNHLHKKWNKD